MKPPLKLKNSDLQGVVVRLQQILADHADTLIGHWIALIEQDIADGWRAFYAREIWMRNHLPAPLINPLGRALMVEQLKQVIAANGMPLQCDEAGMLVDLVRRTGLHEYRNYLHVGQLSIDTDAAPLDLVADAVAMGLLDNGHRHADAEISRDQDHWYLEAAARCTLTIPLIISTNQKTPAVRDHNKPLALDRRYWSDVCQPDYAIVSDGDNAGVFTPKVSLALMAALAPDFPFSEALSTKKRLVFVQPGDRALAWAIMIDKTDGGRAFRYPPPLLLINFTPGRKLKDEDILFHNVLTRHYLSRVIDGPAAMELELRFHLPRYRRLIEIYRPYVDEALAR